MTYLSKFHRKPRLKSASAFLTRFRKNSQGVAAIEFALIAPIMIGIYFGLAEISTLISIDRRVSHTANVAADLVTQLSTADNDELEEIFSATLRVLDIRDPQEVTIELTSYGFDTNTPPMVEQRGIATLNADPSRPMPAFDPNTVDTRILNTGSGVVVARINYAYEPLMLRFTDSTINLTELFLLKPRRSAFLDLGDNPNNPVDCSATSASNVVCS